MAYLLIVMVYFFIYHIGLNLLEYRFDGWHFARVNYKYRRRSLHSRSILLFDIDEAPHWNIPVRLLASDIHSGHVESDFFMFSWYYIRHGLQTKIPYIHHTIWPLIMTIILHRR